MAKTLAWFERELRRLLGFDEVEEIARCALDSFPVSQPVELQQYLEQFLGQSKEVDKLCKELSIRRKGEVPATKSSPQAAQGKASRATVDFWGGGGARGGAGRAPATKSSGRSVGASSGVSAGTGRRGQQTGKTSSQAAGSIAGKGKGKVYQKAAAEEDFWGGGTTSGRSKATTQQQSSSATSGSTLARAAAADAVPAVVPAEVAASSAPYPAVVTAKNTRPEGGSGVSTKGTADSDLSASTANTTTKKKASKQTPIAKRATAAATSKFASGGKQQAAAPPLTTEAKKPTTAVAAAPTPTPEWSGVTCLCMGKTHDVVTNCTSCGKIACVKEGGFGCSFCGSALPTTGREPRKVDNSTAGAVTNDLAAASTPPQSAALKEALARKDRLLLFDRTSASRTRVLDDQGDYFTSHNWLSQEEREKGEAEEKARRDDAASQRGARRQVKMSIDIMGRRVIETKDTVAAAAAVGIAAAQEVGESATTSEGVSLDFGSSSSSTGAGVAASGRSTTAGGKDGTTEAGTADAGTADAGTAGDPNQRVSLENTGLRGRAKEVYDIMRANLEKNRRRPGGGTAAAESRRKPGGVVEGSRVSLWRVQHDVDSDDLLRQTPAGGGAVGGVGDGFEKFEPADEAACAR